MRGAVVSYRELSTFGSAAGLSRDFNVKCPDGIVRKVNSRSQCGFRTSASRQTRMLWWHDLVDWAKTGIGPAMWDWSRRERCSATDPSGRRCSLPQGHVSYLRLEHRTTSRRRFVRRVTPYWPSADPKRRAA